MARGKPKVNWRVTHVPTPKLLEKGRANLEYRAEEQVRKMKQRINDELVHRDWVNPLYGSRDERRDVVYLRIPTSPKSDICRCAVMEVDTLFRLALEERWPLHNAAVDRLDNVMISLRRRKADGKLGYTRATLIRAVVNPPVNRWLCPSASPLILVPGGKNGPLWY